MHVELDSRGLEGTCIRMSVHVYSEIKTRKSVSILVTSSNCTCNAVMKHDMLMYMSVCVYYMHDPQVLPLLL